METVRKCFISLIITCKFRKKKALLRCTANQVGTCHKLHIQPKHPSWAKLAAINNKNGCDTAEVWCRQFRSVSYHLYFHISSLLEILSSNLSLSDLSTCWRCWHLSAGISFIVSYTLLSECLGRHSNIFYHLLIMPCYSVYNKVQKWLWYLDWFHHNPWSIYLYLRNDSILLEEYASILPLRSLREICAHNTTDVFGFILLLILIYFNLFRKCFLLRYMYCKLIPFNG